MLLLDCEDYFTINSEPHCDEQNYVMKLVKSTNNLSVYAILLLVAIITGCGKDNGITDSPADKGTITIDQTPNTLAGAGWRLSGPLIRTGSGDLSLKDVPLGSYTLAWDSVSGYIRPSSDMKTLDPAGTIAFEGTYLPEGFVLIPAGNFMMGSPGDEPNHGVDETLHAVTLTTPFYMSTTEVTNQQFAEMAQWALDQNPPLITATSTSLRDALYGSAKELMQMDGPGCEISFYDGTFTVDSGKEMHPVKWVTWYGAAAYCDWLSLRNGLPRAYEHSTWLCNGNDPYSAQGYRLPTEAEWEYACRAETETPFNTGICLNAGSEANYNGNYPYSACSSGPYVEWTVSVGSFPANTFDLYDMHGNVWEWCNDGYGSYDGDVTDPVVPTDGTNLVIRGGSWYTYAFHCRSAYRYDSYPAFRSSWNGFRPVRSAN